MTVLIRHAPDMPWTKSPMAGVWRKRLEHIGPAESGVVTSLVRYDPGSAFRAHPHPDGEEILVLDGVFSDETGDHQKGSYLLNPEGFSHAPRSGPGCVLFVKLRQYPGLGRQTVRRRLDALRFAPDGPEGQFRATLYAEDDAPETMSVIRLSPRTKLATRTIDVPEEVFVLEGRFADEHGAYAPGSFIRRPAGTVHTTTSDDGCLLYVKTGSPANAKAGGVAG